MAVTQQDIAEKLNLSRSLVSGVLNNKSGVWASEETRQRILTVARELNYRPHAAARALRSARTHAIALPFYVPEGEVGRHGMVIGTLARFLSDHGYHLLVDVAQTMQQNIAALEAMAASRSCDAVVLWGNEDEVEEQANALKPFGLPFVTKGYYDQHPDWLQAEFDHAQMMIAAIEHLSGLGHMRIAYLGHRPEAIYSRKLRQGFCDAFQQRFGHTPPDDFVSGVNDEAESVAQMRYWLSLLTDYQPTAVVIATGEEVTWRTVEFTLAQVGRRIGWTAPDFAVTGLRHTQNPLLWGHARAFPDSDLSQLTEVMCQQLLLPLLKGESPASNIVRVPLQLSPVPSLDLSYYLGFSSCIRRGLTRAAACKTNGGFP